MVSRLFLVYVLVELAVLVALASTIGLGWTLLLLLAAFVAGLALAGSQLKRQLARLRNGLTTQQSQLATDGVMVALGSLLVVITGLVTTAAGLLLLLPPTRAAARPVLTAMAVRGLTSSGRGAPVITVTTVGAVVSGTALVPVVKLLVTGVSACPARSSTPPPTTTV